MSSTNPTPVDTKEKRPNKASSAGSIILILFLVIGMIVAFINVFRDCGMFGSIHNKGIKFLVMIFFWPAVLFCWGKKPIPTIVKLADGTEVISEGGHVISPMSANLSKFIHSVN